MRVYYLCAGVDWAASPRLPTYMHQQEAARRRCAPGEAAVHKKEVEEEYQGDLGGMFRALWAGGEMGGVGLWGGPPPYIREVAPDFWLLATQDPARHNQTNFACRDDDDDISKVYTEQDSPSPYPSNACAARHEVFI
ncbi:hypothetical protein DAPPUDRAFT_242123 [Daphnia pulex]|uniref:Uncharacterized protein n=1 Tax=Daphnia pulex TaxID=6669 RepID=E9GFX8_DAPPU|nr:hypothetical protein DAPPUDRAFT_242123 [Daphnia pulex]|eukprot:EFX81733.1 hypothetical protein DAPPUDRAFT_242123 [Daphnia pulex]